MKRPRVLVVGGASGIGAACVRRLTADGVAALVIDRQQTPAQLGAAASAVADVRDHAAVADAVNALVEDRSLDGLVYAAGVGAAAPFESVTERQWRLVLAVNLDGAFHAAQTAVTHMSAGSALVFISSIDSIAPVSGLIPYCVSKAGLDALSRGLALELGPRRIRSNVIAPGPVETPLMDTALARIRR